MSPLPVDPFYFLDPKAKSDPLSFLAAASEATLETLILARLSTAANLQKDIARLVSQLADEVAYVKIAEMLLDQKRRAAAKPRDSAGGE